MARRTTRRRNPMRSTGMLVVNPRRRTTRKRRNTRRKSYFKSQGARKRAMRGMYAPKRRRTNRRRTTRTGMVRRTARRAYKPRRRTNRKRTTRAGMRRRTARRAYRRNTRAGGRRKTARRAYRRTNRKRTVARRRNTHRRRRRNPSIQQTLKGIPLIGKPLAMMWAFAPPALLGAISVEPTMILTRLLGPMFGDRLPASVFYAGIGLVMAAIVQYLPIPDKQFRDKLSVAVASAAGGVAFYKWRLGMDASVADEVGLLQLHGAGSAFGALELFPGPLNGYGALELFPGPLNGYGDGMAYSVNPYPGAISNNSY